MGWYCYRATQSRRSHLTYTHRKSSYRPKENIFWEKNQRVASDQFTRFRFHFQFFHIKSSSRMAKTSQAIAGNPRICRNFQIKLLTFLGSVGVGCPPLATGFAKPGGVATPPVCERGHFSFIGTSLSPAIDFSTEGQKRKRKRRKGVEFFFCHRV